MKVVCALFVFLNIAAIVLSGTSANAAGFRVIYAFTGGTEGGHPSARLLRDASGDLYGTTAEGGTYGVGTIFKVTHEGAESVLYSFRGKRDGLDVASDLIRDGGGNLYGTAQTGGKAMCIGGCGTIFRVSPRGDFAVLFRFHDGNKGKQPLGPLLISSNGNLYGTAYQDGANGVGVVFERNSSGKERVLHAFGSPSTDGAFPTQGVVQDAMGNLYGTTSEGGLFGQGTLFRIDPRNAYQEFHAFGNGSDGSLPAGAILDAAGNLYGATSGGGQFQQGVVYKIVPDGREKILYSFSGNDGTEPAGQLVRDKAGNLYGAMKSGGGKCNCGTVFEVSKAGVATILHRFTGKDGRMPVAGLAIDHKGRLYGTTVWGGAHNFGEVFEIDPS